MSAKPARTMACPTCRSEDLERDPQVDYSDRGKEKFYGVRYFCVFCGEYFTWDRMEGISIDTDRQSVIDHDTLWTHCMLCGNEKPIGETCLKCENQK